MGGDAPGKGFSDDPYGGPTWSGQGGGDDPFGLSGPAEPFDADPFRTDQQGGWPLGSDPVTPNPFDSPSPAPVDSQPTGRRRDGKGLAPAWIAAVATVVAAVIGAVVVLLQPEKQSIVNLQPGTPVVITAVPGQRDEGPSTLMADISDVQLATPSPCCQWAVQIDVQGFAGRRCALEAEVVDLLTGTKYERADTTEAGIEQDRDRASFTMSLPLPPGQYQVVFLIRDDNGVELDRVTTAPFISA